MSIKVGNFVTTGDSVGNTIVVTGVGFTPKAILFFWSSLDTDSNGVVSQDLLGWGYSFATSPTKRGGVSVAADDAQSTTSQEDTRTFNDGVVSSIAIGTGAETGRLDLQSMDADGFTLRIDDQFPGTNDGMRVNYIAIGGDELSADFDEFRTNAGTGNQSITGVGFRPDIVFFITGMAAGGSALPQSLEHGGISFGAMTEDDQYVSAIVTQDARDLTTLFMVTKHYTYDAECIATFGGAAPIQMRASFVSMDADGFTINIDEAGARRQVLYLAIKGNQWKLFDGSTLTSVADLSGIDVGFVAEGGMVISTMAEKNAQDVSAGEAELNLGAFEADATQRMTGSRWRNIDPSDTGLAQSAGVVYVRISDAFAVDGLMYFKELSGNNLIFSMSDADPTIAFFWGFAMGEVRLVTGAPIFF